MFAVLHIADFALQAVLRTEPAAVARPAALFIGSGKKSIVHAANPPARAAGVELGMTPPQAVARCPQLLIRTPSVSAETEARAALLAIGFTLAPKIEDTAPGLCTIDLTGADPVHIDRAARAAISALEAQDLPATAGLAATPLLALYAARAAHDRVLSGASGSLTSTIEVSSAAPLSLSSFSLSLSPSDAPHPASATVSTPACAPANPSAQTQTEKDKDKEERERFPEPLPLSGASGSITSTSKNASTTAITPTAAAPLSLSSFSLSLSPSDAPQPASATVSAPACAPANPSAQTQTEKDKDKEERERFPEPLPALLHVTDAAHDHALDRNRNPYRPLPLSGASGSSKNAIQGTPTAAAPLSLSSFSLSFSPPDAPHPASATVSPPACAPANPSAQTQTEKKKDKEESERLPEPLTAILHVTDAASFLAPLPLAVAEPPPELAGVLHTWGLRTLGDLTTLPRDEIVRRFGAAGLALWQRATGGEPRPLRPVTLPQTFTAEMTFEQEIETLEPLLFILRRFLDRLSLELRATQHVAAEQHLTLRLEDDTQHARSFRLPELTADPEILFRALHTHLETLQTAASIIAVALRLTPARPLVRQQDIFETGLRDPHGFAETLARVSALVGPDRVGTPQLEDTHRPDAVKLTAPAAVIPPAASAPLHAPLGAPLRRFRPPLPARLEFTNQRPTYLWTEPIRGEISAQSSAYPSNGDWWQPDRLWQRTEWDIALADGGLYRLLLIGDSYFLEGEYD